MRIPETLTGRICATVFLLLLGWCFARAGSHGAAFVFKQTANGESVFTPMVVPQIGVQIKSGPREINRGEVLVCKQGQESTKVTVDGQESTVTQFTLTCGERVFILTSIHFDEQ